MLIRFEFGGIKSLELGTPFFIIKGKGAAPKSGEQDSKAVRSQIPQFCQA